MERKRVPFEWNFHLSENFSTKGNEFHHLEPFIFNNVNDGTPWKVAPLGFSLKLETRFSDKCPGTRLKR